MSIEVLSDLIKQQSRIEKGIDIVIANLSYKSIGEIYLHYHGKYDDFDDLVSFEELNEMEFCSNVLSIMEKKLTKGKVFYSILQQGLNKKSLMSLYYRFNDMELTLPMIRDIVSIYDLKTLEELVRISKIYQPQVERFCLVKIYDNPPEDHKDLLFALTEKELSDNVLRKFINEILWRDGIIEKIFSKHDDIVQRCIDLGCQDNALLRFVQNKMYSLVAEMAYALEKLVE